MSYQMLHDSCLNVPTIHQYIPWLRMNAYLARILQDPCKKHIPRKILQGNFFLARTCKEMFSLKILQINLFIERSC